MRKRYIALIAALAALVPMLMAPTGGGLPSRPRFLSVGVGTTAPTTTGNMTVTGTLTANALQSTTTLSSQALAVINGPRVGFFQASGTGIDIGSTSNHPFSIYQNDTIECRISSSTSGLDCIDGFQSNGAGAAFPLGLSTIGAMTSTISRTNALAPINSSASVAAVRLTETDQPLDEKQWEIQASANRFSLTTQTDAGGAGSNFLTVERTGTAVDSVNIAGTVVQANGSTIWTAGNDGAGSGLDADTIDGVSSAGFVLAPITCTTTCSGAAILVGQSLVINKGSATSRASTVSETDDPDLAVSSLPSGRYRIEAALNWSLGAGGGRYRFPGLSNSTRGSAIETCDSTTTAKLVDSLNDDTCAGTTDLEVEAMLRTAVGVSGAVAVSWAQNTSNAANTTLNTTSWLMVTRLQ